MSPNRLSLLVLASFLTSPIPAQERVVLQPPAPRRAQKNAPATAPTEHHVHVVKASPADSDTPFELTADPQPGHPGDGWAQQPIPDFLKGNPYRLSYIAGDYTPPKHERFDPAFLKAWHDGMRKGVKKTYGFIMFQGRITNAKLARVAAMGVQLNEFHTFQCFSAEIPFSAIPRLNGSRDVRWVGFAKPWQKIHPELVSLLEKSPDARARMYVTVYASDMSPAAREVPLHDREEKSTLQAIVKIPHVTMPNGPFQKRLEQAGAKFVSYIDRLRVFQVDAPLASVAELASLDFVHAVEFTGRMQLTDDRGSRQIAIDTVRHKPEADGSSTIVGMLDTGAYLGSGGHVDLNKRAVGWNYVGGDSVFNETHGHGTGVLGTICGTGTGNRRYTGCVPAAGSTDTTRIFIGRVMGTSTSLESVAELAMEQLSKSFTDTNNMVTQRPHVINCSWTLGNDPNGLPGTDAVSRAVDDHTYNDGQLYCFGAGNSGGSDYPSQILKSIGRPSVAKNAMTTANCSDWRGSTATTTYDAGRPYFSAGKGPTSDGRFKPNVMAPGHMIRGPLTQTRSGYFDRSGSSLANPHTLGTIAGVMDHFSVFKRKPALAKAWIAATSNPYGNIRSWSTGNPSYYYRQGLGQVDAYKAHYQLDRPGGFQSGWASGTLTSNDAGTYFEIDVPSDAERALFVLNFDEGRSSSNATRACLADLDLYIDAAPYTGTINTGDFASRRTWDTWEWYWNVSTIGSLRGKKVRVKISARVRPLLAAKVHWGVGYLIHRGDSSPDGTLTVTSNKTVVKPGEPFVVTAAVDVPESVQTNCHLTVSNNPNATPQSMRFTTPEGVLRRYTATSLNSNTDSLMNWTLGHLGFWYSPIHSNLTWVFTKSTNGREPITVRLRSDNRATNVTDTVFVCADNQLPNDISNLQSTSHFVNNWSNDENIVMTWSRATDVGCAGVDGLAFSKTLGQTGVPTTVNLGATDTTTTFAATPGTTPNWFNIRVKDNAKNLSKTISAGPFLVDKDRPVVTSVTIDGGATSTASLTVKVRATGTDASSGVSLIRFSGNNGSTWTRWMTYNTSDFNLDMTTLGWTTDEGTKTAWVQLKDVATNESGTRTDTIEYRRAPTLSTFSPASLPSVTRSGFRLTGSDLSDVTTIAFGSTTISSQLEDDWHVGYFRIVSDTTIDLFPPQAQTPGAVAVTVSNAAGTSNSVSVQLDAPRTRTLHTPPRLAGGRELNIYAHRGPMPTSTFSLLTLSGSSRPSVIPGVVSLEHGNMFQAAFFVLTPAAPHDPRTGIATWRFPVPNGISLRVYFEAVMIDGANARPPFDTSNHDAVEIYTR